MKRFVHSLLFLVCLCPTLLLAQNPVFEYGVASGDPLHDRVIIWTRVSPAKANTKKTQVRWQIAADAGMQNIVKSGKCEAVLAQDYTVKVDVIGLQPGQTYYYRFETEGQQSPVGRTKTAPTNGAKHLRFAVVSCSNYQAGFFNAYARIADREDLDAVIHLGDYIYEYGEGSYGDSTLAANGKRSLEPKHEIVSLADYRQRYAHYRRDPDLQRVHQMHPFITVWDDHESANDAYTDGAQNHNEGEGSWAQRQAHARQVYAEWMPIRGEAQSIYRKINYGSMADILMLDTRLEGREEQIKDVTDPALYAPDRTILGKDQRQWLLDELKNSTARWKVIGNQVVFAEFNVGWAAAATGRQPEELESIFLDIWDGYPAERAQIIDFIREQQIDNVVLITGDIHSAYAFDIAKYPSVFSRPNQAPDYQAESGEGAVAVEFVSPSVTSANFDENIGAMQAKMLEYQINKPLPNGINPNPHMKFVDLTRHGYFILDLSDERAQADWYFVETVLQPTDKEVFAEGWFTNSGENRLQKATAPAK
jgi:alkaline phosphatase D